MNHISKNKWTLTFLALVISIIHFVPFYIALTIAFKPKTDLSSRWLLPKQWYFENFSGALKNSNIAPALVNNIIITVSSLFLVVLIASLAAYPLARRKNAWNAFVLKSIIAMMIIPPMSVLVPLISLVKTMGGISTLWGIILVLTAYQLPIAIFLFTKFIAATIPASLDESAMLDGASALRIYWTIILPLLKPIMTTVIILTGVALWNDYQFSLYLLQSPDKQVITLAIASFFSSNSSHIGQAAASTLIAVVPITVLFLLLQKYFIRGMVEGSIK